MEHFFRLVLLYGICIIPLHFVKIENKFIIQIGAILGVTVAYVIAIFIIKKMNKKSEKQSEKNEE